MIVRGTQLSDRRLLFPNAVAVVTPVVESKPTVIENAIPIAQSIPQAATAIAPQEPKERALTFESVVAWLAVQDPETKESCASILASEVTRIYESAKNDGYDAGRKSGEIAARKEIDLQINVMQKIGAAAEAAFLHEEEQLQNICVEVIGEALAKIGGALLGSEQAAIGAIKQVLTRVKEGRELTIRVAREDFELVRKLERELSDVLSGRKYEIVADSRVELGGCLVETKLGSLDGRLEVQLRELYETLRLAKLSARESQ
jgi:flagellar assembly protein FliH